MRNTIKRIYLTEKNLVGNAPNLKEYYDTDEVVLVCLGRKKDGNYSGLIKMLDVLFSEDVDPKTKKHMLESEYNIKMSEEMQTEVYEMCDYSLGVYDRGAENPKLSDIVSIMKNLGMSLDKALEALNVPKSDYAKYEELLK